MASIDLNIKSRSAQGTEWIAKDKPLRAEDLDDVTEYSSDNGKALNSLPTPFARFYIFKEAFRRVKEEYGDGDTKGRPAGLANQRLVSDCLDVFELIFNLRYHRNIWGDNADIKILEWDSKEDLNRLTKTNPLLGRALSNCYNLDIAESKLYFVVFNIDGKKYLLGTSSPFTGFITPPDLDKEEKDGKLYITGIQYKSLNIQRKSGGCYFKDILLFEKRDKDFKNYMYRLFLNSTVDKKFEEIIKYMDAFKHDPDITDNYPINTKAVMSNDSAPVVVNNLSILQNDEIDINSYFQPYLIRMPYKIAKDEFEAIAYATEKSVRNDDYLIPFKAEGISLLSKGATYHCQVKGSGDVEVTLTYNGFKYKKTYKEDPLNQLEGKLVDLYKKQQYVNLGIFPNILSHRDSENNYFKVVLAETEEADEFLSLNIDKCSLRFYKKDSNCDYKLMPEEDDDTHASYGVYKSVVRSTQSLKQNGETCGTKYYEIFETSFDAIEIIVDGASGMVIPKWKRSTPTKDSYTYAIDLGTSNTFISRIKAGSTADPEQLTLKEPMVSYLHAYSDEVRYSTAHRIESALHAKVRNALVTQFAPAHIEGREYDLPIRTALCHVRGSASMPSLFSNINIAFFYEKAMQHDSQEVITDIKWDDNKEKLACFIKELMLIIKADILQRNGLLNQTSIVRFRPLSFDSKIKNMNAELWNRIPAEAFGVQPRSIQCFTESEAPYYYFITKDIITNTNSVAVVDIGGGSTDIVYFEADTPLLASSIHFGCDVLWSEGHVKSGNGRSNGIFAKYNHTYLLPESLEPIHSSMVADTNVTGKDIINFWLSNQKHCNIISDLRNDYAPLFVYHLTSILFYMASMFKYNKQQAPRTIVFSGNGSKYIDNFISSDIDALMTITTMVFESVYGKLDNPIYIVLPSERKENTCYGGLYRDVSAPDVPETVYHGTDKTYADAKGLIGDATLKDTLMEKYEKMNSVYKTIIIKLKTIGVIDRNVDVSIFFDKLSANYRDNLDNHFRSEVEKVYNNEGDVCNDSVFFIPIIDKIYELTKIY